MLLEGKKILVTGVLDRRSIAFSIAEEAQRAGAEIVLTSFGRVANITKMMAKRLPTTPDVLELDATKPEDAEAVCQELRGRWGHLDGWVHSIAFAPDDALGGSSPWTSTTPSTPGPRTTGWASARPRWWPSCATSPVTWDAIASASTP